MSSNRSCRTAAAAVGLVLGAGHASAAIDLAALEVQPQRGQSAEQARRDRYECHNWAIEQTGVVPLAAPAARERDARTERERRAERIARVLNGVAIGAGIGGLVRAIQDEDVSNGVLAGAAVGAVVGAATTGDRDAPNDGPTAAEEEYLRALSACLEGRGYSVTLPDASGADAATVAANERGRGTSKSFNAAARVG